jgi:hypothetical protein
MLSSRAKAGSSMGLETELGVCRLRGNGGNSKVGFWLDRVRTKRLFRYLQQIELLMQLVSRLVKEPNLG